MNDSNIRHGEKGQNFPSTTEPDLVSPTIAIIGDILGIISTALSREEKVLEEKSPENQDNQLLRIQKHIDYINNEFSKIIR